MSWESMGSETRPCWCGKGTIVCYTEMDDWNRVRQHTDINCEFCKLKQQEKVEASDKLKSRRDDLYQRAKAIAESKYLQTWVDRYSGLSKVDAWRLYTGGVGYPSLGTFRKHVKEEGFAKYFQRVFSHRFEEALDKMGVVDPEIKELLTQMEQTR
jgi:hypothetical protein